MGLKNLSIRNLLAITYVVLTVPAVTLAWATLALIERDTWLLMHPRPPAVETLHSPKPGFLNKLSYNAELLINSSYKLDRPLRYKWLYETGKSLLVLWTILISLGVIIIVSLGMLITKPFNHLAKKLDALGANELDTPVAVHGPKDIVLISECLDQLRIRLLENEQQQHQFLRHISHEIKTPLTSIKEGAQLLSDELLGSISERQREITDILNKSTAELQESIENLLNYNSIISKSNIKQREMVCLASLINKSIDKHALSIKNKHLVIKSSLKPIRSFINKNQINTVFDNLLSNAIKFSPTQGIVKLCLSQQNSKTIFTIQDQGPGVNEHQKHAIFDAFYVGDQAKHTTLKGTGLGLSIAKQYVEFHHQGTLKLLNARPGGAMFQMTLEN